MPKILYAPMDRSDQITWLIRCRYVSGDHSTHTTNPPTSIINIVAQLPCFKLVGGGRVETGARDEVTVALSLPSIDKGSTL